MKSTTERRSRAGLLLVEAVVSLMIFLVASFSIYSLLAHARRAEARARETVLATALARELLEAKRIAGFSALTPGVERGSRTVESTRAGQAAAVPLQYETRVSPGPSPSILSVLVTVRWRDTSLDMETYVAE